MYNLCQLLKFLGSFPDFNLRSPEFNTLIFKGLNPHSDVERDIINERVAALIKVEICKRFNGQEAQYYCQKIDDTRKYSFEGANPLRVWIYSFHMALFFFISGILHKERSWLGASIAHFAKALLLPAAVFGLTYLLLFIPLTYFGLSLYNDFTTLPVDNHLPFLGYTFEMLKFVVTV